MTIHWKAVEQHFNVVLFAILEKKKSIINFGFGTVRSERVKGWNHRVK